MTHKPAPRHRMARRPIVPITDLADTLNSMSPVRSAAIASVTGLALTAVAGGAAHATTASSSHDEILEPTTARAVATATSVVVPDIAWSDEEVTASAEAPASEPVAAPDPVADEPAAANRSEVREAAPAADSGVAAAYAASGGSIAAAALSLTGIPYVWGGESFAGADCSGLVKLAYQAVGISLPHSASAQIAGGRQVSPAEAQPGDIVGYPGHSAIYIGNGQMVEAVDYGVLSRVSPVRSGGVFVRY